MNGGAYHQTAMIESAMPSDCHDRGVLTGSAMHPVRTGTPSADTQGHRRPGRKQASGARPSKCEAATPLQPAGPIAILAAPA